MSDMPPVSDEFAAELVVKLQIEVASPVHGILSGDNPTHAMLILKLWAKVQALEAATAFIGGVKPVGGSPQ